MPLFRSASRSSEQSAQQRRSSIRLRSAVLNWLNGLPIQASSGFQYEDERLDRDRQLKRQKLLSSKKSKKWHRRWRKWIRSDEKGKKALKKTSKLLANEEKKHLKKQQQKQKARLPPQPSVTPCDYKDMRVIILNEALAQSQSQSQALPQTHSVSPNSWHSSSSTCHSHLSATGAAPVSTLRLASKNAIHTSKYSLITFLPRNLFEQFRRIANSYFLLLVILQFFPFFSNVNPLIAAMPLIVIVGITGLKDGLEDWKRWREDCRVNQQIAQRLVVDQDAGPQFAHAAWRDLLVGDILILHDNESIPADALILGSSEEGGLVYVETQNLDGETNLKIRQAIEMAAVSSAARIVDAASASRLRGRIEMEGPNSHLYSFSGRLFLEECIAVDDPDLDEKQATDASASDQTGQLHDSTAPAPPPNNTLEHEPPPSSPFTLYPTRPTGGHSRTTSWAASAGAATNGTNLAMQRMSSPGHSRNVTRDSIQSTPSPVALSSAIAVDTLIKRPSPLTPLSSAHPAAPAAFMSGLGLAIHAPSHLGPGPFEPLATLTPPPHSAGPIMTVATAASMSSTFPLAPPKITHTLPIYMNHLLLRGCTIRNTAWVICLIVYTGKESKLMMNLGTRAPSKRSRVERQMNPQIIINFFLLFLICLLCAIFQTKMAVELEGAPFLRATFWNIDEEQSKIWIGFLTFWSSLILFQTIVPIALYITVEICKTFQAYFIYSDKEMYDARTNAPCVPKAWNLSDDLGQIEYVFSDKTGTLTRNVMEFRKASIGGRAYGLDPPEDSTGWQLESVQRTGMLSLMKDWLAPSYWDFDPARLRQIHEQKKKAHEEQQAAQQLHRPHAAKKAVESESDIGLPFSFVDPAIYHDLSNEEEAAQAELIIEFFTMMALCHTVLVPNPPALSATLVSELDPYQLMYKAQSPDEAALVGSARSLGFTFLSRHQDTLHLSILGQPVAFTLLHVLEFNSLRKRMSVIVRDADDRLLLYCKGADSVIYPRLLKSSSAAGASPTRNTADWIARKTQGHLERWAERGLRTLCFAYRELSVREYESWRARYLEASSALSHRELLQDALAEEIETRLVLLGATGIEDQLQDDVPEAISTLRSAGIKIWVLTGDKMETAINIGFSCHLLEKNMLLMVISGSAYDETDTGSAAHSGDSARSPTHQQQHGKGCVRRQIKEALEQRLALEAGLIGEDYFDAQQQGFNRNKYASKASSPSLSPPPSSLLAAHPTGAPAHASTPLETALIIDGPALKIALEPAVRPIFLELATRCSSVLCCRASPLQKARVVELVKRGKLAMTLAIGDGANDVSMIRAADVGVGISGGQEGVQAVMASDYSISQFRYLVRLLLLHGRWSYERTAGITLASFYKNIVFSLVLFWYQLQCAFTASFIYDYMVLLFYNLFFCVAPVLALGLFDRDASEPATLALPPLYRRGIQGRSYNIRLFLLTLLETVYQSLVCYYLPVLYFGDVSGVDLLGSGETKTMIGSVVALNIILTSNLYVGLLHASWTVPWTAASIAASLIVYLGFFVVYGWIDDTCLYGAPQALFSMPLFYLATLATQVVALGPKVIVRVFQRTIRPNDLDITAEISVRIEAKWRAIEKRWKTLLKRKADTGLSIDDKENRLEIYKSGPISPNVKPLAPLDVELELGLGLGLASLSNGLPSPTLSDMDPMDEALRAMIIESTDVDDLDEKMQEFVIRHKISEFQAASLAPDPRSRRMMKPRSVFASPSIKLKKSSSSRPSRPSLFPNAYSLPKMPKKLWLRARGRRGGAGSSSGSGATLHPPPSQPQPRSGLSSLSSSLVGTGGGGGRESQTSRSTHSTSQLFYPRSPFDESTATPPSDKPTALLNMRTGQFERLRGFAFSQEGGMTPALLATLSSLPFGSLLPSHLSTLTDSLQRPSRVRLDPRTHL